MANLITTLTDRIESYRAENKNPCKNYSTEERAEKATAKIAKAAGVYFDKSGDKNAKSAEYVVFYIEDWNRWVGCINMSELLRRPNSTGGYMGFCGEFFTY